MHSEFAQNPWICGSCAQSRRFVVRACLACTAPCSPIQLDCEPKAVLRSFFPLPSSPAGVQAPGGCRHPHIVSYYGCHWSDGHLQMYLEYMAGGSLSQASLYGMPVEPPGHQLSGPLQLWALGGESDGAVHAACQGNRLDLTVLTPDGGPICMRGKPEAAAAFRPGSQNSSLLTHCVGHSDKLV